MTNKRMFLLVVIALALPGCVGDRLRETLEAYKGQDIDTVVAKLGYPTEQREMLGRTIYTWKTGNPSGQGLGGFFCNLDIVVDQSNRIDRGSWQGNNGGCGDLLGRLR